MKYKGWILAGIILSIVGTVGLVNRGRCAYYGYQTQRDTHYAAFIGCMVKVNDNWVPRSELRSTIQP